MSFVERLRQAWERNNSLVCVGLDPEPTRFPPMLREQPDAIFEFCRTIVDATADLVCCFKPQIAFFSARRGEEALERLIAHIHAQYPHVPVILDAKRGDLGSTAQQYAAEAFDRYGADAVTLNPYMGTDALQPFLDRADHGCIILCHTSNEGARDLQELGTLSENRGERKLYQHVADLAARQWNANGNCALVVGATFPEELADVRDIVGDMPILVPGIGAQGGDVAAVVAAGRTASGHGLMINSSRAILYAGNDGNFADQSRDATIALRDEINRYR